jgi:hypothetical protein
MVGEYPLEIGLVTWGFFATLNVITGAATSNALNVLPDMLVIVWAILMGLAAVTVAIGLVVNRFAVISSGMYLFATILVAYSIAIVSASGWQRGGAIAGFLGIIGIVCLLRGWWLREQEVALIKEIERKDGT